MVGFHLDISDRKRAEQALVTSETRLKTLVNALPFGVWVRDANDVLVLQNAVDIAHYGFVVGTKLEDLDISPEHIARYRELKERCQPGEVLSRETIEVVAGEERAFLRIETPLSDGVSGGVGMLGVAIDVTELKRAREALQLSEERLRALINALPFGIWVRDAKGRLILQNTEDIARFGDLIGTDLSDGNIPSEWAAIYAEMQERCQVEGIVQYERPEIINGEERTFIHIDAPLPEIDGGMGLFGVAIDITDRKRAEQQIQRYAAQLEATNKELESFTYSVSHDLRAPLRHIGGFINALRLRLQNTPAMEDDKVSHYLNVIEGSSHKMGALIEGLLTLSRVGRREMQLRPVNLQELVHQAIQDVQGKEPDQDSREQPKSHESVSPSDRPEFTIHPLPTVKGDAVLLRQVFYNLIENALKFSGDRHPPRIEIGTVTSPSESPSNSSYRNRTQTLFIKDNGVGFDMKYADQLFGAFQRLHSEREFSGTGIGLAIVHRIVHRHGGEIWAESRPGEGACFFIQLDAD
jgi:PAS domain S-box-containing protein